MAWNPFSGSSTFVVGDRARAQCVTLPSPRPSPPGEGEASAVSGEYPRLDWPNALPRAKQHPRAVPSPGEGQGEGEPQVTHSFDTHYKRRGALFRDDTPANDKQAWILPTTPRVLECGDAGARG